MITREDKGSPLTHEEMDNNFKELQSIQSPYKKNVNKVFEIKEIMFEGSFTDLFYIENVSQFFNEPKLDITVVTKNNSETIPRIDVYDCNIGTDLSSTSTDFKLIWNDDSERYSINVEDTTDENIAGFHDKVMDTFVIRYYYNNSDEDSADSTVAVNIDYLSIDDYLKVIDSIPKGMPGEVQ